VEVSQSVGFAGRVLRAHFLGTHREISRQHREYLRDQPSACRDAMKQSFREVITRCRAEHANPQQADIMGFLSKLGVLRSARSARFLISCWS
jgi:hypothetical protein